MLNIFDVLDEIAELYEKEGFHQNSAWKSDGSGSYEVELQDDNGEKIVIYLEIQLTEKDIEEINNNILDNIDTSQIEEEIKNAVTKAFEDDGCKQNNYWEYDYESDTYWASFIDSTLEGYVASVMGITKEDIKNGKYKI